MTTSNGTKTCCNSVMIANSLGHVIGDTRRHSLDNVAGTAPGTSLAERTSPGHTFPLARGAVALTVGRKSLVRFGLPRRKDVTHGWQTDSHEVGVNAMILGPEVNGAAPVGDDVGHTL